MVPQTMSYSAAQLHRLVYTWTTAYGFSLYIHLLALITVIGSEAQQKPAGPVKSTLSVKPLTLS